MNNKKQNDETEILEIQINLTITIDPTIDNVQDIVYEYLKELIEDESLPYDIIN